MIPPRSDIPDEDAPATLNFFFTGRCNLNCSYCFVNKTNLEHVTVDEKFLKNSVDTFLCYPGRRKKISFKGGEPLIEFPLVKKICDYARVEANKKQTVLDVSIVTNGTLLNQGMADYFLKYNISVVVSIDGTQISHDRNRPFKGSSRESSFQRTIQNVDTINFDSIKLTASMVFTPINIDHLVENIEFLNKKKFYGIEFYPDLYAEWTGNDLETVKENFRKFEAYYISLFDVKGKVFKNHMLDRIVNDKESWKADRCRDIHLNPEKEYYICDKVLFLEPQRRKLYVIGNAANGIDEQKRKKMLKQLCEDFTVESGLECSKCLFQKYCFCPIGHHIYASNLRDDHRRNQVKSFYKSFCRISQIYNETFLRIKSALRYNPRFIALYPFVAPGW